MTDSVGGQAVGKCNFMMPLWEPHYNLAKVDV